MEYLKKINFLIILFLFFFCFFTLNYYLFLLNRSINPFSIKWVLLSDKEPLSARYNIDNNINNNEKITEKHIEKELLVI